MLKLDSQVPICQTYVTIPSPIPFLSSLRRHVLLSLPLQTLGDTIKAGRRGVWHGGQSIRSSIHGSTQAQMVIQMNKLSIWEAETLCCESHTYENMWSGGKRAHGALISSSHVHHMNSWRNNKASMLLKHVFVLSCGLPNYVLFNFDCQRTPCPFCKFAAQYF